MIEMLATVVLLGIMGVALTAGIGAVRTAYNKVVKRANEQVLLSTTITEMRNLIQGAEAAERSEGGIMYFKSPDGYWFHFISDTTEENNGIKVNYLYLDPITKAPSTPVASVNLIPRELNSKYGLYSAFGSIDWANKEKGIVKIEGLSVKSETNVDSEFVLNCPVNEDKYYISCFNLQNGGAS